MTPERRTCFLKSLVYFLHLVAELFPSVEPALEIARKYLTAKVPQAEWLEEFRVRMSALRLSGDEIERLCDQWAASLNNAGKWSTDRAMREAAERKKYAKGHFDRMANFADGWLESPTMLYERVAPLRAVIKQVRGG